MSLAARHQAHAAAILLHAHKTGDLPAHLVRPGALELMGHVFAQVEPEMAVVDLSVVVNVGLCAVVFEDLVTQPGFQLLTAEQRVAVLAEAAAGRAHPRGAADPLAQLLLRIAHRLSFTAQADTLWHDWSTGCAALFAALVPGPSESTEGPGGGHYTVNERLERGRAATGLLAMASAGWMLMGDLPIAEHLPLLREAEHHLATAMCLARDLRSVNRDRQQGTPNVLFASDARAPARLEAMIDAALARGHALLEPLPAGLQRAGRFLGRLAERMVAIYRQRDVQRSLCFSRAVKVAVAA